jgi:hypothetical protein
VNIKHYPELEHRLWTLFNEHDMQSLICLGAPPDEYETEVEMVMARIGEITSIKTARDVLYSVFTKMFGQMAGTPVVYTTLASDLFKILKSEQLIK